MDMTSSLGAKVMMVLSIQVRPMITFKEKETTLYEELFKLIMKWQGPKIIHGFLWNVGHGGVWTNVERHELGLTQNNLCKFLKNAVDSIFHIV